MALRQEWERKALVKRYPTPLDLGMALNPEIVSTPALRIVSNLVVDFRDALEVMYERRSRRSELVRSGIDETWANEQAADEIPARGRTRIIDSLPAQEGKSTVVSRYGPLWLLMQFGSLRFVLVSYDGDKASEFSYRVREDIETFNGQSSEIDLMMRMKVDQKAMSRWELASGGGMYAIGVGGGLSGRPADALGIDDPTKDINAAESILQARNQVNWWETVARPRLAPGAPVMVTATRWAENDFPGQLMARRDQLRDSGVKDYDDWHVVNIPAQCESVPDILGRRPGEFMLSARGRTNADWEQTKAMTSARFWSGLYQGNPTPGTGNIILRHWWRYYDTVLWTQNIDGTFRVPGYDLVQSWDMAFKNREGNDFVACGVWAKKGADAHLVYLLRARLSFVQTLEAFRRITHLFPQARRKLVEDKANGPAVISTLKHEIPGIVPVPVKDSKPARAEAITTFIEAGNIWLPVPEVARASRTLAFDVPGFVDECSAFPFGTHDDQVDQMTQYVYDQFVKLGTGRFTNATKPPKVPQAELTPMQQRLAKHA